MKGARLVDSHAHRDLARAVSEVFQGAPESLVGIGDDELGHRCRRYAEFTAMR